MNLPSRIVEIVNTLYERNIPLAQGSDDQRRILTRWIAEQCCFEFNNDWGTKAQSVNHPQSKDAIAFRLISGAMDVWDWQNGSTRQPQVTPNQPPNYPNLFGQFFIQVLPIDHIGVIVAPPVPPTNPPTNPPNDNEVLEAIAELKTLVVVQHIATQNQLAVINGKLDILMSRVPPNYVGRLPFLGTITLTPVNG